MRGYGAFPSKFWVVQEVTDTFANRLVSNHRFRTAQFDGSHQRQDAKSQGITICDLSRVQKTARYCGSTTSSLASVVAKPITQGSTCVSNLVGHRQAATQSICLQMKRQEVNWQSSTARRCA